VDLVLEANREVLVEELVLELRQEELVVLVLRLKEQFELQVILQLALHQEEELGLER
jgi:hypothetical protein